MWVCVGGRGGENKDLQSPTSHSSPPTWCLLAPAPFFGAPVPGSARSSPPALPPRLLLTWRMARPSCQKRRRRGVPALPHRLCRQPGGRLLTLPGWGRGHFLRRAQPRLHRRWGPAGAAPGHYTVGVPPQRPGAPGAAAGGGAPRCLPPIEICEIFHQEYWAVCVPPQQPAAPGAATEVAPPFTHPLMIVSSVTMITRLPCKIPLS